MSVIMPTERMFNALDQGAMFTFQSNVADLQRQRHGTLGARQTASLILRDAESIHRSNPEPAISAVRLVTHKLEVGDPLRDRAVEFLVAKNGADLPEFSGREPLSRPVRVASAGMQPA